MKQPSSTPKPIRIVIADDHFVIREGLRAVLSQVHDMKIVGEGATGQEAVEICRRFKPDVLVSDLRMPGLDGHQVIPAVMEVSPTTRVMVLTVFDGHEDIYRAVQVGALAYVLKGASREELLDAIRTVYAGRRYVPPAVAARLAERVYSPHLTDRERQVLQEIAAGRSNKQVAAGLQMGMRTVKAHLNAAFRKLGVKDRTEALAVAIRRGIVKLR